MGGEPRGDQRGRSRDSRSPAARATSTPIRCRASTATCGPGRSCRRTHRTKPRVHRPERARPRSRARPLIARSASRQMTSNSGIGSSKPLSSNGPRASNVNPLPTAELAHRGRDEDRRRPRRDCTPGPRAAPPRRTGRRARPRARPRSRRSAPRSDARRRRCALRGRVWIAIAHWIARATDGNDAMIPSPVCLTSLPPFSSRCVPHDLVVDAEQLHGLGVAEALGHVGRADDVGEEDRAERRLGVGLADRVVRHRSEEARDRVALDLDDLARHLAVRLAVHGLGGRLARGRRRSRTRSVGSRSNQ